MFTTLLVELTSDEQVNDSLARDRSLDARVPTVPQRPIVARIGWSLARSCSSAIRMLNEDFGQVLYCLGTGDDRRKNVRKLYRKLGVDIPPDAGQIVAALSRLPREPRNDDLHKKLVDALTGLLVRPLERCAESRRTPA